MARCRGTVKTTGQQCAKPAVAGAVVCRSHGAGAPQVRRKAAILAAVAKYRDGDPTLDPFDLLTRIMTVTALRAEQHAAALDQLIAEHGWVEAFVGDTLVVDDNGRSVKVGEYARMIATWEQRERTEAADLALKAISSGLMERQVRVLEQQTKLVAEAMRSALMDAGLADRAQEVLGHVGRHLRVIAS